jgi:ATP-dependent DNA helicase DinG
MKGLDGQGEALSCGLVDRLHFAVPSDQVVAARMKAIEKGGGKPFFDCQVSKAVRTLKHGFGRLVRSLEDRGASVLLNPLIQTKRLGRTFLDGLPPLSRNRSDSMCGEVFYPTALEAGSFSDAEGGKN